MKQQPNAVGQHIRQKVIPLNMSVKDAAARLGVGRPALSNLLNGKASLSPVMALRLERAFGANRDELLGLQASHDRAGRCDEEKEVAVHGYVPSFLTFKAHDIECWADSIDTRECLPVLLRKLVHGTGRNLELVDFPGFDNSQRQGWDGWVEAGTATAWIPKGVSGWEFGTAKRPRQKAESDYAKRLGLPLEERAQCTFVFVTPRNWPGKTEWVKEKEASRDGWKAVRAYDASDLEQWLDESIAAPIWLAERLPASVDGVRTLEACWTVWAQASEPRMTKHIFESSVTACVKPFCKWLKEPPQRPFVVAADSRDEALAFLACLLQHDDIPVAWHDLTAVFDSAETLTALAKSSSPFIPIAANAETQQSLAGLCQRMHCIAMCPRNAVHAEPNFALELMGYTVFEGAITAMGFNRHEADRLAKEAGRSPTILRRRLACIPALRTPQWAVDTALASMLIPLSLVGAWHKHTKADQEVLSALAVCPYEDIERNIACLMRLEDCPVWSVGQYRGVASKIDLLFSVAPMMTEKNITDYLTLAEYVLSESDPALELPETDRWKAAIHGKVRDHSDALRNGVCETLVLLSVHGNNLFQERLGVDVTGRVSSLVTRLLTPLDDRLQSQERDLPAYAEAAPDKFLELLEEDLREDKSAVLGLLKPAESLPFGHCPRTGLLWALECVAWNPDNLSRVCVLLAKLSRTKIEDNWANKPIGSLAAILRSWMPQTAATLNERIAVLKMLADRFPDLSWQLCLDEITVLPRFAMDNYRPRWRSDAASAGGVVTEHDAYAFIRCAADLLLERTDHDHASLSDLVERIECMSEEQQSTVWCRIDAWAQRENDEKAKAKLREGIRHFVLTRRGRRNHQSTIERARLIYESLQPRNLIIRHAWLFANAWVQEPWDEVTDEDHDFEARRARIDSLRQAAMKEIWDAYSLTGLQTMVKDGSNGYTVGQYAALCAPDVAEVLQVCLSIEVKMSEFDAFMGAFIAVRANPAESELLLEVSRQVDQGQLGRLWRCAPFQEKTWRMLDRLPEGVRTAYWRTVSPLGWQFSDAECTEIVDRLLAAGRPQAAFSAMKHQWQKVETDCLKRLLIGLISSEGVPEDAFRIASRDISDALETLNARPGVTVHEMARLEFAFIHALGHQREHRIPNIERLLSESPALFVGFLSHCFKRRDGGQDPKEWQVVSETRRKALAESGYELLRQVVRIPGTEANGSIDLNTLLHWLEEARRLCADVGRREVGDLMIGELLSRASPDEDGTWPCSAVCGALEAVASEDVAQGFIIGKRNARGVVTRSVGEGGDQERELAAKYRRWARQRSADYPFASNVIKRIAEWYDDDAEREDRRATVDKRLKWG